MSDFTSLQTKVNDLKAKVEQNSISPAYLGSILDDFIKQMKAIDMSGMSDSITKAVQDASAALQQAKNAAAAADEAKLSATSATKVANSASDKADAATQSASIARTNAADALSMAADALAKVIAFTDTKGQPNGIAPLDEGGRIPARYLPGFVNDVIEFNSMVSAITVQDSTSTARSTDAGCMVVYDKDNDRYLLAVYNMLVAGADNWGSMLRPVKTLSAPAPAAVGVDNPSYNLGDIWDTVGNQMVIKQERFKYYAQWADADDFGTHDSLGQIPEGGKVHICTSTNQTYRWSGSELIIIGSDLALGHTAATAFPGDEGAALLNDMNVAKKALALKADKTEFELLKEVVDGHGCINANAMMNVFRDITFVEFTDWIDNYASDFSAILPFGTVVKYLSADGWREKRYIGYDADSDLQDVDSWEDVEIGSAIGNCFNVTVEIPLSGTTNPYYTLKTAIEAVTKAGKGKLGMQITFAATATAWKMYQFIGSDLEGLTVEANWLDMAGTSAGKEEIININDLCGEPSGADFYSFESAIDALARVERDTKVVYRKAGMVITYRVSASAWETLQLAQKVTDYGTRAAWTEFGGGSKVETSDEMKRDGKDAFSTGGAFNVIPTGHEVTQEGGTVAIQFRNNDGEPIMEPITFLASTGGGSVSGTVVTIKPEQSTIYGALGSNIATKVAIRSVTMSGNNEVDNAIASLEIVDRESNLSLWKETVNKASSPTLDTPTFDIDFTSFITQPGTRRFNLIAVDETGAVGNKFITVTAEDITLNVSGVQVLNVREDAMISPSMTRATVDLFKYDNFQSDKGIETVVDMLIDGEWTEIHRSVVTDAFTKAITFNPQALGLKHGAYPIRIYGTSKNSGIRGNTVYSTIFVVDPKALTPLVGIRYDDNSNGKVRLYESVSFDVAVYNPKGGNTIVNTRANSTLISQLLCDNGHTYNVKKQIQGFADGDVIKLFAKVVNPVGISAEYKSYEVSLTVEGSVIDATLKEGALYSFDFSSRSNTEADKSITDGDYSVVLQGANYTTNGFGSYLGQNCLRIAENVKATLNHAPFASPSLESSGMAFQMSFATRNIKDSKAKLLECYDPSSGAGFYIRGNMVGIYCRNGVQQLEERKIPCGEQITLGVVTEPASIYVERSGVKYSALRMYLNGELVAHIGYIPGRGDLFNARNITMDGTNGDLYVYYMLAYQSHYEWAQAFKNYLVKLVDTDAMIEEYNAENVLFSQTAEGTTAQRPSSAALWARGIHYVVLVASQEDFDKFDGGTSTSDNFEWDVYYYDPKHPWRSFVARKCRIRRQGTTSAKRCKKNVRIYLSKASSIEPLFPDYTNEDALLTYRLFAEKTIRVGEKTMAVDLITIKVDYSDAGGANDCGVCDMMNATYRALGEDYMTPAQRFFDGTQDIGDIHLEGLELNHSTANHPIAVFRSDSDTLQNVWFEAKGNWKEDKGEQTALGFMNTPGYNLGCINYQDEAFVEYYGLPGESLTTIENRFKADATVDTTKLYLLTEYCGNRYRFMRYKDGKWANTTGSMRQTGGKGTKTWTVTGDVLNPVTGFELLTYQELDWWRGVNNVNAMMLTGTGKISSWVQKLIDKGKVTADVVPLWTYYFECMVDNDDLAIAYAQGKKVPFELYRMLRFCDRCDPDKAEDFKAMWRAHGYMFMNVRSNMVYYGATDYNSLYDQQAKNMQPMFFLEDGCYVDNGIYYNALGQPDACIADDLPTKMLPLRMYFNKVYDADGANGKDNDGGCTGDPECDPGKPTDDATGYANPYAGWNSILWVNLRAQQELITDDAGNKTDLRTVIAAMRSVEAVVDGIMMKPFSPEGANYFFLRKRLKIWPKLVSSYDGIRKYVQYTATSDTIYFYALQGLGLTSLPTFIEERWRIRDGYYQTGAFFSGYISFRVACPEGATIPFTAGKTGYYGIGNDSGSAVTEAVYLEAGQSYEFTNFSHQNGALLYIFQADRMSRLDLSQLSLGSSDGNIDFSTMMLVVQLILGSATHVNSPITGVKNMSGATFGNLPFLEELNTRRTGILNADLSGCPRLRKFDARDSSLQSFDIAQTSPINDVAVPGSITDLKLLGLPNLTYTGLGASTGLQIPSMKALQNLRIESSPKLQARKMLVDALGSQSAAADRRLSALRFNDMPMKGDASELHTILDRGVAGLNSDGDRVSRPVINAEYELTTILEQYDIENLEASIEGLTIATVIEAFIELIDMINAELYSADSEVAAVNLDNIGDHLLYYNGETYEEYLARVAEENRSIHDIINL